MNEKYLLFREKYPNFIYEDYSFSVNESSVDIEYHFTIPGLAVFKPTWSIDRNELITLGSSFESDKKLYLSSNQTLDTLIFSLGLVELISYWKATCSPTVHIRCGKLSQSQVSWWKKLYKKGLGEFFYLNEIVVDDDFMEIVSEAKELTTDVAIKLRAWDKGTLPVLIPIGGGKDSATTIELLRDHSKGFPYIINPRQATIDTVDVSGIPKEEAIIAKRTLDQNIIRLNKEGFLNGHTPFSAIVAFSSVIAAYINHIPFIALSNESSANESTVLETDINHQYSKSYEFELDFRNYEDKYIKSGVEYFSLLRPLTELKIAQIFSKHPAYHDIFRSCNVGSKADIWCGNCSKCLFVYIILSPFLPPQEVVDIFGKDLFEEENLRVTFDKLLGILPEKPFECVGSRGEVNAALFETLRQYESRNDTLPYLLAYYKHRLKARSIGLDHDIDYYLNHFDENNSIPDPFYNILKNKLLDK